jgi:putative ABC transport system permease protein
VYTETLARLTRDAVRGAVRSPGFGLVVVLSLALGIGANTALFTIIDAVLLRPLPYPRSHELVTAGLAGSNGITWNVSPRYLDVWLRSKHSFGEVAAFEAYPAPIATTSSAEYREGAQATPELLKVLGIGTAVGRWFSFEEQRTGLNVVVLGYELARRAFASDSAAIGRTLTICGRPWTVIGVLPAGASEPFRAEFWIPMPAGGGGGGQLVARVRTSASIVSIEGELHNLLPPSEGADLRQPSPAVMVESLHDQIFGSPATSLRLIFAAAFLLFLLACTNIAYLSLARVLGRRHELAVRVTLGATRTSLVAPILAENFLLAILGAGAGVLVATWATRVALAVSPPEITRVGDIHVSNLSIIFAAALALGAALLVSSVPAFAVTLGDVGPLLQTGSQRTGAGRTSERWRRALVVTQLVIALLLMTGAGLCIRSLSRLSHVNLGFDPRGVVTARLSVSSSAPDSGQASVLSRLRTVARRLESLPGVSAVSLGPPPLVAGRARNLSDGFDALLFGKFPDGSSADSVHRMIWVKFVDDGYLRTYRIPIRRGRDILSTDDPTSPAVAVVNESASNLFFHGINSIGRPFPAGHWKLSGGRPITVVGEIGDVHQRDVAMEPEPEILLPASQQVTRASFASISVRTSGPPDAMLVATRQVLRDLAPDLPVTRLITMQSVVDASVATQTFLLYLFVVFGMLAVVLASFGLYAVVAFLVAQRTQEIGVRLALGAQKSDVLALVLREGLVLAAIGCAIGTPIALITSRVLAAFLYEISPRDAVTLTVSCLLLTGVSLSAAFIPALRASRVDPMRILRKE